MLYTLKAKEDLPLHLYLEHRGPDVYILGWKANGTQVYIGKFTEAGNLFLHKNIPKTTGLCLDDAGHIFLERE